MIVNTMITSSQTRNVPQARRVQQKDVKTLDSEQIIDIPEDDFDEFSPNEKSQMKYPK